MKEYGYLQLNNGIKCLLVSDQTSEMAHISMGLGFGLNSEIEF